MSESGREALSYVREWSEVLLEIWEALTEVREWSGSPAGVVGRPSRMSGNGRVPLPDVREWLGGPLVCPGVVASPSQMSESGPEGLNGCPGEVGSLSSMSGSGREPLPDV